MAVKSANVMARVEPEVKERAEQVMAQLGLPVSVVINALYRQIIMNNGLPFALSIPSNIPSREQMTTDEFNAMMEKGLEQAKCGQGKSLDKAFKILEDSIDG